MEDFKLYDKVADDYIVYESDSVTYAYIYYGRIGEMKRIELEWHDDKEMSKFAGMLCRYLTLNEIKAQCQKRFKDIRAMIRVFIDDPKQGYMFEYGNQGDFWECTGILAGYW